MEWVVGTFTLMAVMAAITSGGMGIRLLYIDMEYGRLIRSESERISEQRASKGPASEPITKEHTRIVAPKQRLPDRRALSDLYAKRNANRSGVTFDGICMITILAVGLITALGFSSSLYISAIVTFIFFINAVVLLQYHVLAILHLSR